MSELADNNCIDLDDGCESETIKRLFPRCQPKKYESKYVEGKRDLNLNEVVITKSTPNDNDHLLSTDKQNDNTSVTRHRAFKNSWIEDNRMEEDHSVHSAYNIAGRGLRTSHTGNGSTEGGDCIYDESIDVGYRIKTSSNIDNSRIELAGGREKISQSVLRTAKKKHSEESVRYNPNSIGKQSQKRCSGEIIYDDKTKEYKVRSWNQSVGTKSHKTIRNFAVQNESSTRHRAPCRISPTSPQDEHRDLDQGFGKKAYNGMYGSPASRDLDLYNDTDRSGGKDKHYNSTDESPSNGKLQVDVGCEMQISSSGDNTSNSSQQNSPVGRVTRLIGNVPIAEYDGSPRRYGPRPGFPIRISTGNDDQITSSVKKSEDSPQPNQSTENSPDKKETKNRIMKPNGVLGEICDKSACENGILANNSGHQYSELEYKLYRLNSDNYVGKRLAQSVSSADSNDSPKKSDGKYNDHSSTSNPEIRVDSEPPDDVRPEFDVYNMLSSERNLLLRERIAQHSMLSDILNHDHDKETISNPDTEDLGETEIGEQVGHSRNFTLSPETTDCDSNDLESELSAEMNETCSLEHSSNSRLYNSMPILEDGLSSGNVSDTEEICDNDISYNGNDCSDSEIKAYGENSTMIMMKEQIDEIERQIVARQSHQVDASSNGSNADYVDIDSFLHDENANNHDPRLSACDFNKEFLRSLEQDCLGIRPDNSCNDSDDNSGSESVSQAIREIKEAIQHSRNVILKTPPMEKSEDEENEPVWVPRQVNGHKIVQETDDEKVENDHDNEGVIEEDEIEEETDRLLGVDKEENNDLYDEKANDVSGKKKNGTANRSKEVIIHEPAVLIEGVLFRARYLGSTQLVCEGQPTKATRMMQAEEAVSRIKAPEGESQPSTDVDLFISTEKIMVLNTDLKEIMMDHALRTISYIADIGDLVVLMARRRPTAGEVESNSVIHHTPKMICHVFESEEAQFIAQSIGQAFQVAYMEFLKANGIEDSSFVKEMDYQEVLNSQQIFGDELEMFAKKDKQKEVIVPKAKGEILGMVIVESGWGSMLPTVVIANMAQGGPAARCGQLNIGDQIIAINGVSLVGLPLSTCQTYIKNTRNQTVVKLTMVPCPPVVEVKIKRPDTKYQLGFSVQNGVICSLLRGGIAERGGVRVGHRIIEINTQSVVAVPHERIVNLLATSVGEIDMKTMPTSMFRLLTGQDTPIYI